MDLLQLRYFYESSKNENFSTTAAKYMVPTTSVSASIRRLENELGQQLFDRFANRIKLNHNGSILSEALEIAFSEIDSAIETITNPNPKKDVIRILARSRSKWITELAMEFKRSYPNVYFYITYDPETIDYDSFDIITDDITTQYKDREKFMLSIEQLKIKSAKENPLANRVLTLHDIVHYPFVIMGQENHVRRLIEKIGEQTGVTPKISIECTDRQCMINCVENDMGLMIGAARSLQDDDQKNLVALNVTDFDEQSLVHVYYQKNKETTPVFNSFLSFLKNNSRI